MIRTIFAAAAIAALSVPAIAASVTIDAMAPTTSGDKVLKRVVVKFDDLNPADTKDAAALYERLTETVARVCASNPGGTSNLMVEKVAKCRTSALKQAVKDVGTAEIDQAAHK